MSKIKVKVIDFSSISGSKVDDFAEFISEELNKLNVRKIYKVFTIESYGWIVIIYE